MTMSINVQNILVAKCATYESGEHYEAFDAVDIVDNYGASVSLFFPKGKGPSVASAINAALSEVSE